MSEELSTKECIQFNFIKVLEYSPKYRHPYTGTDQIQHQNQTQKEKIYLLGLYRASDTIILGYFWAASSQPYRTRLWYLF
ncbi:hypothetical protein AQUCO_04500220v1 [Aquilegia coerulea]|uniref:Uncharacterized protein n=1 Tax=Aquilegia coerulea TaxID=218851 RepID=A0A2G5CMH8_AQUCA|nr:hypothetical protein AQUCO_04500220v1 [Aquilegia coerulea]